MPNYLAITSDGRDGYYVIGGGEDLDAVRKAAEAYVSENAGSVVSVFQKGSTVTIVCAPKWQ